MRYCWLILILFCSLAVWQVSAFGQAAPATPPADKATPSTDPAPDIAPDAAVIKIDGVCDHPTPGVAKDAAVSTPADGTSSAAAPGSASPSSNAGSDCKTIVTRAQFERLTTMMGLPIPPPNRAKFAARYPEMLAFAQKAHELGLENDPRFGDMVRFGFAQSLAQAFSKYMQEKGATDAEVEAYYKEHPTAFEQVELRQIVVPKTKQHPEPEGKAPAPKVDLAADAAAMKLEGEKIQRRAVAGGDLDKLQDAVLKVAGVPEESPDTDYGKVSLDDVPTEYRNDVAALQPGKVTALLPDENGWSIFKLVSRRTIPLSEAKPIAQKRIMKMKMDAIRQSIKIQLNDAYFKVFAAPPAGNPQPGRPQP